MKIRHNLKQVTETIAKVCPWDFTGPTSKLIETLKSYDQECKNKPGVISVGWEWESPDENYLDGRFILQITRLENDKEYKARIKLEEKIKKKNKLQNIKKNELELQEYLRLKKKFEKVK